MNRNLCVAAFLLGLVAVCWVGFGYIASSPLALTMTAIIGAVYVLGALEMRRFHLATASVARALAAIPEGLENLGDWLAQVHPSLQNPVRLRIEGERAGLPGPAMTPYLVGLLVILGMLGTFLGMVVTLNGAVLALESTTDLQAIRAALAAPVKGLGLAFGTSVAGVAASALLGLISALCRRERLQVSQLLDTRIATALRPFSLAQQRQETFKALQFQAQALPEVVDKLQAMMSQLEKQNQQLNERLLAGQEGFYRDAKGVYTDLAAAVDRSLKESLTESARLAGATIQPVVEATMAGIARESTSLQEKVAAAVQTQLEGLSGRFDSTVATVADTWTAALARHERSSEGLNQGLQRSLESFTEAFDQRSSSLLATVNHSQSALQAELAATMTGLARETTSLQEGLVDTVQGQLEGLSERVGATVATVAQAWTDSLARHESASETLARAVHESVATVTGIFKEHSGSLLATVNNSQAALQAELAATMTGVARETASLHEKLADTVQGQLGGLSERFGATVATVAQTWTESLARHEGASEKLARAVHESVATVTGTFQEHSGSLLATVEGSQSALQADVAAALSGMARENTQLHENLAETLKSQLAGLSAGFGSTTAAVAQAWQEALGKHEALGENLARAMHQSVSTLAGTFDQRSASLLDAVGAAHAGLQTQLAARDEEQLAALTRSLEAMAASLQQEWRQAGAQTLAQQNEICRTLDETARGISSQAAAQASTTIGEVTRLMETAAEAPRAAAEVIGQLRRELSDSINRDNELLAERSRIMETLGTLLEAINHASREQRGAIDSLVASSSALLDQVSARFSEKMEAEAARMVEAASQVTGGAVEVASLGEAFGHAVQLFSESNDKLMASLQRIEGALAKSMARSDEQLAYYVAQAREIIDLSIMSQKQIVEDLQQLSGKPLAGEVC